LFATFSVYIQIRFLHRFLPLPVIPSTKSAEVGLESAVGGVTSLGDDVFVVRSSPQVEVFDANTMSPTRTIPVPGLGSSIYNCGLAACHHNKCLYVLSYCDTVVHRIELKDSKISKWSVPMATMGLSVTGSCSVLIASYSDDKLYEYTSQGRLIKTIVLQSGIQDPTFAVQMSRTASSRPILYGVTHFRPNNAFSVMDDTGKMVKTYGKSRGCDVGKMKSPRCIAVSSRGLVFIADSNNNRIVCVNPQKLPSKTSSNCDDDASETDAARVLPVSVDGGLQRPLCLCLDESRDRLYIGEQSGGRVVVVGGVSGLMF